MRAKTGKSDRYASSSDHATERGARFGYPRRDDPIQHRPAASPSTDAGDHLLPHDVRLHRRGLRRRARRSFVREYIAQARSSIARTGAMPDAATERPRRSVVAKFTTHFHEVFEGIDQNVKELFTESVSRGRGPEGVRPREAQAALLRDLPELRSRRARSSSSTRSTTLHPGRRRGASGRGEVPRRARALCSRQDLGIELVEDDERRTARVESPSTRRVDAGAEHVDHPFFKPFEYHYSADPETHHAAGQRRSRAHRSRARRARASSARRATASSRARRHVAELAGERAVPRRPRLRAHAEARRELRAHRARRSPRLLQRASRRAVMQSRLLREGRRVPQGSEDAARTRCSCCSATTSIAASSASTACCARCCSSS